VLERVRKLEERGVLRGYEARVDPESLGLGLVAFVAVRGDDRLASDEMGRRLSELPEVQEVHHIAGEDCYLVKVRTPGTAELGRFLRDRLGAIPTVRSTRTTIVLGTLKETGVLPLSARATEDADD
jgi:Lrp/AsnC family leucine-responsive transcriptional regulator